MQSMERQIRKLTADLEATTNSANVQAEESELMERAVQLALHSHDTLEASLEAIESKITENKRHIAALQDEW